MWSALMKVRWNLIHFGDHFPEMRYIFPNFIHKDKILMPEWHAHDKYFHVINFNFPTNSTEFAWVKLLILNFNIFFRGWDTNLHCTEGGRGGPKLPCQYSRWNNNIPDIKIFLTRVKYFHRSLKTDSVTTENNYFQLLNSEFNFL